MRIQLLLLLPALTQAATRIVGGHTASITAYPYQLSFRLASRHICGASILTNQLAVTAAHCLPKEGPYSIKAGITSLNETGVVIHVNLALVHPNYTSAKNDYDIALLFLASELPFSEKIQPVLLPTGENGKQLKPDMIGTVSGWGAIFSNAQNSVSNDLLAVELPVWETDKCTKSYGSIITERMFCAGLPKGGKDSCQGDSGGPFVVNGVLYGIVSAGTECAKAGYPGIYANVEALREFITEYGKV